MVTQLSAEQRRNELDAVGALPSGSPKSLPAVLPQCERIYYSSYMYSY